jgi:hypothetical protein
VLLHGGGVNSSILLEDINQLEPHFRVYAVDLPGEPKNGGQAFKRTLLVTPAFKILAKQVPHL